MIHIWAQDHSRLSAARIRALARIAAVAMGAGVASLAVVSAPRASVAAVTPGAPGSGVLTVPRGAPARIRQPGEGLALLDQVGGAGTAIVAAGDTVYLGLGPRVLSLDISVAASPRVVASTAAQGGFFDDLAAGGGIVAGRIGSAGKVMVWRRGDDSVLRPAAILDDGDTGTPFHGLAVDAAGTLWLSAGGGLERWDVASGSPELTWRQDGLRGAPAAVGRLVVAGRDQGGVAVIAPGPEGRPSVVGSVDGPLLDGVEAAGDDRALGLAAGPGGTTTVVVYTLADAASPRELGRLPLPSGAKVASDDERMAAAWGGSGVVRLLDASSPVPRPGGDWTAYVPLDVAVAGGDALVAAAEGLYILDGSDPARPVPVGRPDLGAGVVSDLQWRGGTVYAAHGGGLNILRATGDQRLVPVGSVERPGPRGGVGADLVHGPRDLALGDGATVFAASGAAGLVVYDAANPSQPTVMATVSGDDLADEARAVAHAAGRLYVGGQKRITVLDARAPASLSIVAWMPTAQPVQALAVASGHLLVALGAGGLAVATLDQDGIPGVPGPVSDVPRADDVAAAGGIAIAVGDRSVVEIDPRARVVRRRLDGLAGPAEAVSLGAGIAYVGGPGGEVVALAIDPGQELRVLGRRTVRAGSAVAVAAARAGVLTAGGFTGVRLLAAPGVPPRPGRVHLPWMAAGAAPR